MLELLISFLFAILPACPTDEAIGTCAWDASTQGNGQGSSFVVVDNELFPL